MKDTKGMANPAHPLDGGIPSLPDAELTGPPPVMCIIKLRDL
jgi:hypothetical protein